MHNSETNIAILLKHGKTQNSLKLFLIPAHFRTNYCTTSLKGDKNCLNSALTCQWEISSNSTGFDPFLFFLQASNIIKKKRHVLRILVSIILSVLKVLLQFPFLSVTCQQFVEGVVTPFTAAKTLLYKDSENAWIVSTSGYQNYAQLFQFPN